MVQFHKAIVTGGAGFIGSHIVERLLKMGVEVVSIDNYSAGKHENLDSFRDYFGFIDANCDILDYTGLKRYFEGVDVVFHNAASKKTICLRDPRIDLDTNAKGTFNLLELSRDFGVKKFIHASTGSVYGEAVYFPQDENHPLNPTSYYGVSKLAGERYAMAFAHLYKLNVSVLRYFHVFGPRQEAGDFGGVVAIFARKALSGQPLTINGDGKQIRSFTYVGDVVNANMLVACDERSRGEIYNCASGIKVSIQELVQKIQKMTDSENIPIKYDDWTPGDIKVFDVNNNKLLNMGFQFYNFDEGLKETLNWFKQQLK